MVDDETALIVIDVQQGFDDPRWGPRNAPGAEANIERLLQAWADASRPVVLVRHDSTEDGSPLLPGQPGNDLRPFVAGAAHELLVTKHVNSAFHGEPDLEGWLRARGIRRIVLCGVQTNQCVETTARVGGNLGFDVTVALDATHTFDMEGPAGMRLTADELAVATAVNLQGGGFARIANTAELV